MCVVCACMCVMRACVHVFANYRTHLDLADVSVVLGNRKQFIRVNCMPCITHTSIWLTMFVVLSYRKQFVWINCMPRIAHVSLN